MVKFHQNASKEYEKYRASVRELEKIPAVVVQNNDRKRRIQDLQREKGDISKRVKLADELGVEAQKELDKALSSRPKMDEKLARIANGKLTEANKMRAQAVEQLKTVEESLKELQD